MGAGSPISQALNAEVFQEARSQGVNAGDDIGSSRVWAVGAAALVAKVVEVADGVFASSRSEIGEYFTDCSGLPLHKLTLPEPGSVFG